VKHLGRYTIALLSALFAVIALDRLVAFLDLGYTPSRARPNEHRRLERPEFSVDVQLNALGFREPRLPSTKPPGTVRIVALGDSFTQGYGVEEHQSWPQRLEVLLNAREVQPHEVINLGVPGANPRDYLSYLSDPGLAYQPDVVLVMVMANDVQDRWIQQEFGVNLNSEVLADARHAVLTPPPRRGRAFPRPFSQPCTRSCGTGFMPCARSRGRQRPRTAVRPRRPRAPLRHQPARPKPSSWYSQIAMGGGRWARTL
jgi:GDSL-like Lipase/Acylhydrolase family